MSLVKTYSIASAARKKLGQEAERTDHVLRRLVGHANLLETILEELEDLAVEGQSHHQSPSIDLAKADQARSETNVKVLVESIEDGAEDDHDSDSDGDESDRTERSDGADVQNFLIRVPSRDPPVNNDDSSKIENGALINNVPGLLAAVAIDVPSKVDDCASVNEAPDESQLIEASSIFDMSSSQTIRNVLPEETTSAACE